MMWKPLSPEFGSRLARLALAGVRREFPNKLDHVMGSAADVRGPRDLHPAFYGCYDWHSAVHGHWLLARVLRLCPDVAEHDEIAGVLDEHLTPEKIAAEAAYFKRPESRAFERTYGWAWALKLHEEVGRGAKTGGAAAGDGVGARCRAWEEAMRPLAEVVADRYAGYLPRLSYPVRTGVHPNTAFGVLFAWDWAAWSGNASLAWLVDETALRFFGRDEEYPAWLEPSGSDFFSACLVEAALMSRVLAADEFVEWFATFLRGAARGEPASLFTPAEVSDRSDPQIVHLDGLNLSRAWCMRMVAGALRAAEGRMGGARMLGRYCSSRRTGTRRRRWRSWRAGTTRASTGWGRLRCWR
ncbi:MAG: DUF2891 domain-containing protein [Phycisphaerales bacterium]